MLKKLTPPIVVLVEIFIVLPDPRIAPLGGEIPCGDVNASLVRSNDLFILHGL